MNNYLRMLLALLVAAASQTAAADSHPLTLWQVTGTSNTVYLLGSIHMLRASDHPLPSGIYDAYADADTLVMELDMDDIDPLQDQAIVNELGLIGDGRTLQDLMGDAMYAEAEALAIQLQIPLSLLTASEPWYAAITVEVMMLMRAGFTPSQGIEMRLSELAAKDGKAILGLETTRQQLELLDNLSLPAQRDMLLQTLQESVELVGLMDELIDAWRGGDIEYLAANLLADMEDQSELHKAIVLDRNRNWVGQIRELLDDEQDYLVIVGALHLVGDDGVPNLLRKEGLEIRQLSQAAGSN